MKKNTIQVVILVAVAALLLASFLAGTVGATEFESPVSPLPTPMYDPRPTAGWPIIGQPPAQIPTPDASWFVGDRGPRE